MTYPTTLAFRRDPLARAARTLDPGDLRVFIAVATMATDTGRVWVEPERLAAELHLDAAFVLHALRRIAEADLAVILPPARVTAQTLDLGPVFVRPSAPPENLPFARV